MTETETVKQLSKLGGKQGNWMTNKIMPSAQYNISQYQNSNNMIKSVVTQEFPSDEPLYKYSQRKQIVITLDGTRMLDTLNSYLSFKVTFSGTGNKSVKHGTGIHALFHRLIVRTKSGQHILEDINEFNHITQIMNMATMSPDYQDNAGRWQGMGSVKKAVVNTAVLAAGPPAVLTQTITAAKNDFVNDAAVQRQYRLYLHCSGIMHNTKLLPINISPLQIVLELEDPKDCLFDGTAADADYEISDVRYVGSLYEMSEEYIKSLITASKQGIVIPFHSFYHNQRSIESNVSLVAELADGLENIKSVFWVVRDLQNDDKYYANPYTYISGLLQRYQYDSNGEKYPQSYVDYATKASDAYSELEKALFYAGDVSNISLINYDNYAPKITAARRPWAAAQWREFLNLDAGVGGFVQNDTILDETTACIHGFTFERDGSLFSSNLQMTKKVKLYAEFKTAPTVDGAGAAATYQFQNDNGNKRYIASWTHYDGLLVIASDGKFDRTEVMK